MKVAIYTQVYENYGAHDWDGEGQCPQYWKAKGGSTFVIEGLSVMQSLEFKDSGMKGLLPLIEVRSNSYEETVVDWAFHDDDAVVCEEWDSPTVLRFVDGKWMAKRVVENGPDGYMVRSIARVTSEFDLLPGGEPGNFRSVYSMRNGDEIDAKDLNVYLKKAA